MGMSGYANCKRWKSIVRYHRLCLNGNVYGLLTNVIWWYYSSGGSSSSDSGSGGSRSSGSGGDGSVSWGGQGRSNTSNSITIRNDINRAHPGSNNNIDTIDQHVVSNWIVWDGYCHSMGSAGPILGEQRVCSGPVLNQHWTSVADQHLIYQYCWANIGQARHQCCTNAWPVLHQILTNLTLCAYPSPHLSMLSSSCPFFGICPCGDAALALPTFACASCAGVSGRPHTADVVSTLSSSKVSVEAMLRSKADDILALSNKTPTVAGAEGKVFVRKTLLLDDQTLWRSQNIVIISLEKHCYHITLKKTMLL